MNDKIHFKFIKDYDNFISGEHYIGCKNYHNLFQPYTIFDNDSNEYGFTIYDYGWYFIIDNDYVISDEECEEFEL